jgi:N-acetylneuraminate synthase
MEFAEAQWAGLKKHADETGLLFLSSPFSEEAVDLLTRVGVPAWKVPSGEVGTTPLFDRMMETGLPMLLSTGMSSFGEVDEAVRRIRSRGLPFAVLQCTSAYPCPLEKVGLNMIGEFRGRYGCPVGLSDHSGSIFPGLAAVALGCEVLEVHVTLSREAFGPDVPVSLTTEELRRLVEGARAIETLLNNPVDKDALALEMAPMRSVFSKSVVARRDLPAGAILSEEDLAVKKPGNGIPARRLRELVGARLKRDLGSNEAIREEDVEVRP